jgi:uncharacterized repeat protein (TIGR02543 family)
MKMLYYIASILLVLLSCSPGEQPEPIATLWTVTFNTNGGSAVAPIEGISSKILIQKPADPIKANFTFGGWYTDNESFANEWIFTRSIVSSDTVLYASWLPEKQKWTVTFNSNGGSAVPPIIDVVDGAKIQRPTDPSRSQYSFVGWFTDNNTFGNAWNFDQNQVTNDTTLYAKWSTQPAPVKTYNNFTGLVQNCADPYILKYNGKYYLYGTGGNDGIRVYQSDDMVKWSNAVGAVNGYALHKDYVWGDKWFWAPEVYYLNGKFYMFYSAEEKISVAESVSPLGPFSQSTLDKKPFHENIKEIDTHLFIDDNGKKYLYFVRFTNGNEIWVAELNDDLRSIKESTLVRCIGTSQNWEKSTLEPYPNSKVNEGPFVLKHNGWYYLTYSANHYANPNYGVGYATSKSPLGPWTKYSGNPILIGNDNIKGVGHHSFVTVSDGCHYIVYHSHLNTTTVQPRKLAIDRYEFVPASSGADIIKVYGPTTTTQVLCP